jgi:flagellar biosynthesis anti-sigma factor FlgM
MSINDITSGKPPIGGQTLTNLDPQKTQPKPSRHQSSPYQDTVELTEKGNILNQLHQNASEQPSPVDHKKVTQMQQMIDAGTYPINPETIADKLFNQELEMMSLFALTATDAQETTEEQSS